MNQQPIVTHLEILSRAKRSLEHDIKEWTAVARFNSIMLDYVTAPLYKKLEAVERLYKAELGSYQ